MVVLYILLIQLYSDEDYFPLVLSLHLSSYVRIVCPNIGAGQFLSNVSQTISDTATDQYLTTSIPVRTYYESLLCTVMEGNMSDNINEVMNEV
jgi:hypothetical protein